VIINPFEILKAGVHPLLPDVVFAGGSGEVVRLDVGHCQESCTSVPSLVEPDFVDFRSSVAKVSQSLMRHQYTPKQS
jgi:hypothetical protein